MTDADDDIWDSLWHGCAWAAYIDQAREQQGWPDSEATKRRAYRYYEDALAAKDAAKGQAGAGAPAPSGACAAPGDVLGVGSVDADA